MDPDELAAVYEKEDQLKSAIVFSREYLKGTKISSEQLMYLCEEAVRGGCQGHRAEITAARVAMASAALEDAPVRADDLRTAVRLAIFPRSRFRDTPPEEMMMPPPPPPPKSAPKPENSVDNETKDNDEENEEEDKDDDKDEQEEDQDDEEEQGEPSIPEEFMFEAEAVAMEDDMMKVHYPFITYPKESTFVICECMNCLSLVPL
jgi:magnesium chelatase subunit D